MDVNVKFILNLLTVLFTYFRVIKTQLIAVDQCACPDQVATFQCTVTGNGNTVYNVTGCPEHLVLLSTGFNDGTSRRECMNGLIRAYGVHANFDNRTFVSKLNITLSNTNEDVIVECYREESGQLHRVGMKTLSVDPAPPSDVHVVSRNPLTFGWSNVPNHCGPSMPVQYEINAIDCGLCQRRVFDAYAICSGRIMDSCHFAVKTVICGSIIGLSNSAVVHVNDSVTTTVMPIESTAYIVTATSDEAWIPFRNTVVGILILLVVLVVIIIIGMVITTVIALRQVKLFWKQFRRDSPTENDNATNRNQEQGMLHEILTCVQDLRNIMQNTNSNATDQQLQQFLKKHSVKEKNYQQAKVMAKAPSDGDSRLTLSSVEDSNNCDTPESVGSDV